MKIRFHTNLDLYPFHYCYFRGEREMVTDPKIGDMIESPPTARGICLQLEVCGRTFDEFGRLIVEVNIPEHRFQSISEFEAWYKKIF